MSALSVFAGSLDLVVGGALAGSCVAKVHHPRAFMDAVRDYEILPPAFASAAGVTIFIAEGATGVALLIGEYVSIAAFGAAALFAMFGAAVTTNLRRGRMIKCGCSGPRSEWISGRTLIRLGLLLAAAVALGVTDILTSTPSLMDRSASDIAATVAVAAAAVCVGLLLINVREARSVFSFPTNDSVGRPPSQVRGS